MTTLGKFLDKSETINYWNCCGLDLNLDTWKKKLFSRQHYDKQIEQEKRIRMRQYAINDCTALYFYVYPSKAVNQQTNETTPTPTTNTILNYVDELSDISDDELIELLRPKFDRHTPETTPSLIVTTTQEEIDGLDIQQQQPSESTTRTTTQVLTKSRKTATEEHEVKVETKKPGRFSTSN